MPKPLQREQMDDGRHCPDGLDTDYYLTSDFLNRQIMEFANEHPPGELVDLILSLLCNLGAERYTSDRLRQELASLTDGVLRLRVPFIKLLPLFPVDGETEEPSFNLSTDPQSGDSS
jgi:hypothetical protein